MKSSETGYEIMSDRLGKIDGNNSSRPFVIIVSLCSVDEVQLRGPRKALLRQLDRAATEGTKVCWYAYGCAELLDEQFELASDSNNIGHLFVKL